MDWTEALGGSGHSRTDAHNRLHALLLRGARSELHRRSGRLQLSGPELDDLAHQAAADAFLAVTAKLDQFRGESRFTTWAYGFVVLEVASKLGRHFWLRPTVSLGAADWERLPARFGVVAEDAAQYGELFDAVRCAVQHDLTEHQRRIFVAIVVQGIPLDAMVVRTGSTRNAIYKTMFDARRKLRTVLAAAGHLDFVVEGR